MKPSHTPDPVDVYVGERIRRRRKVAGMSQITLAEALGVSFQQVQKYERGANRVSASMLVRAAKAQGVAPAYYFEGLGIPSDAKALRPSMTAGLDWLRSAEAIPVAEAMAALPEPMRQYVLKSIRDLGELGAAMATPQREAA